MSHTCLVFKPMQGSAIGYAVMTRSLVRLLVLRFAPKLVKFHRRLVSLGIADCRITRSPIAPKRTKAVLRCGEPDAPWDENCCRRDYCVDGACGPGFICTQVAAEELFVLPYATMGMDGSFVCESWSTWQYNPFSVCVAQ
jgi:hypothetical protein